MSSPALTLRVNDSKAIKSAEIKLADVTVLAGVNASGKSTLARMFHQLINLSAFYPLYAKREAWKPLVKWSSEIQYLHNRISAPSGAILSLLGQMAREIDFEKLLEEGTFNDAIDRLKDYTLQNFRKINLQDDEHKRAVAAFVGAVEINRGAVESLEDILDLFYDRLNACVGNYNAITRERRYHVYNSAIGVDPYISWLTDAKEVELKEGGNVVYSIRSEKDDKGIKLASMSPLREIYGIKNAIYIASPWVSIPDIDANKILRLPFDGFPHSLYNKGAKNEDALFAELNGSVELDESSDQKEWKYIRSDGLRVRLVDCATGIKTLAILDILYNRGYLNRETLLIIDEPEAHLHPQWIVEFARILLKLAKNHGVHMLLTTHSPDMVHALRDFSENSSFAENTCFYLSEKEDENDKTFVYRNLGMNIGPIFSAFNVAKTNIGIVSKEIREGSGL